MRKYFLLTLGIVLFLSTALPLLAASRLEKDMTAFDKAYIPALVLTNQGDKAASEKAMKLTMAQWLVFKKRYAKFFNKKKADKEDLKVIAIMIADADRTIKFEGKLDDAHETLEGVRNTFLKIRQRNSIDYYIDYITKFHKPMEAIVFTAQGKTAETLTDPMLLKIKGNFKVAKQSWQKLQNASFDPALFSFSAGKDAQRLSYIQAETETMNKLGKALEGGDKGEIIKAAMEIKSNFVSLFLMFGDFEKVK
ncbi:MAG: hypothetical protein AB2L12_09030 [Smithellaceae bacterium]